MVASHHDREEETLIAYFQQMLAEVDDEEFDGQIQASDGGIQAKPTDATSYSQQSNQQVLKHANAAIEASHSRADIALDASQDVKDGEANPSGGLERISTRDMLSREMAMAVESAAMADEMLPDSPKSYDQENTSEYQIEKDQDSYGYSRADPAMELISESALGEELEPQPQVQAQKQEQSEVALDYAAPSDSLQRLLESIDTSTDTATATAVAEPAVETATKVETPAPVVETATAVAEPVVETATKVETPAPVMETATKVAEPVVEIATAVAEPVVETATKVETPAPVVETPAPVVEVPAPVVAAPAPVVSAPAPVQTKQEIKTPAQRAQERMSERLQQIAATWQNVDLGEQFQVLFFLVQGVRFAVPLIDLGGIFECDKITQLFGKPSWFMGITDIRGTKINIVNTLRWVMPEIGNSPDKYPYLISLGASDWAIGCDVLEGNRTLNRSQIKWREIPGSRPWLAGIVTSEKCALLHVKALISLFEAGADIEDLNRDLEEKHAKDNQT